MGQIFLAAIQSGSGDQAITALCALKESQERKQEDRELNAAMAEFQGACPVIRKNKEAQFDSKIGGRVSYEFATLDQVVSVITPVMSRCGLSYSFDSEMTEGKQVVKCTVRHIGGGSRTSTYSAPIGGTTTMSEMQKGASALTYARRYSLLLAFGLGTADMDDDGEASGTNSHPTPQEQPISPNELTRLLKQIVKHIPDGTDRRKFVEKIGVTGDPKLPASWTRDQFAAASKFCEEMEGPIN